MKWENIKKLECPHCSAKLYHDGFNFRCIECAFIMTPEKYAGVLLKLKQPEYKNKKPFKWQNVKYNLCPICEGYLFRSKMSSDCVNPDCGFKIRADKLEAILADRDHPCNKYFI